MLNLVPFMRRQTVRQWARPRVSRRDESTKELVMDRYSGVVLPCLRIVRNKAVRLETSHVPACAPWCFKNDSGGGGSCTGFICHSHPRSRSRPTARIGAKSLIGGRQKVGQCRLKPLTVTQTSRSAKEFSWKKDLVVCALDTRIE